MPDLTTEELKELDIFMAEKVMRMTVHKGETIGDYWKGPDSWISYLLEHRDGHNFWEPTQDMNQAMMCADKADIYVSVSNTLAGWTVIADRDKVIVVDSYTDIPLAICRVIREAKLAA